MVPYMIYTMAVIGWFLLVIEAMVAAPIVSLGFVIPSGEELGKVVPGLMLLIGIVLRPVLTVFGFILAARLLRAVIALVNFGMADTFRTIPIGGSLLAPVAAMALYVGFIIALVNKVFILIYLLADRILRWIGGGVEQTDANAVHEAKQTMEKGAQLASKAGGATAGESGKAAQGRQERKAKEKADAESNKNTSKDGSGLGNQANSAGTPNANTPGGSPSTGNAAAGGNAGGNTASQASSQQAAATAGGPGAAQASTGAGSSAGAGGSTGTPASGGAPGDAGAAKAAGQPEGGPPPAPAIPAGGPSEAG